MINLKIRQKFISPHCDHIVSIYNNQIIVPIEKGNLYLGGLDSLQQTTMEGLDIKAVVSVIDKWHYNQYKIDEKLKRFNINYNQKLWIQMYDLESMSIQPYFKETSNFIMKNLQKGNVLVHCQKGRSRSATIVLAFLMSQLKMTLDDAFQYILSKRGEVDPIPKFWQQLKLLDEQLKQNDTSYGSSLLSNNNILQKNLQKHKSKSLDEQ